MKLWKIEKHIPAAEAIIEEIKEEFITWTKGRKFAPTINALKAKLNAIKASELDFQQEKYLTSMKNNGNNKQPNYQNYNPFCQSFKDDNTMVDESIEWIEKVLK
jgi:glutamyl-tRNA reductase